MATVEQRLPRTLSGMTCPAPDGLGGVRVSVPLASVAILGLLVVLSLLVMSVESYRPAGSFPLDAISPVLTNFAGAFFAQNTLHMLANTAIFSVATCFFAAARTR
jgi:hypothetical protein